MKKNIKKSINIFILSFAFFAFSSAGFSATLYLITSADTYDLNIGGDIDSARMQKWARTIASYTGMQLKIEVYHGAQHTQGNIVNAVRRINPGPDDMVFFFYSGHGFRDAYSRSAFPSMRTAADRKGVELFWILKTLAAKNPRFVLVMGDLCNNIIPAGSIQTIRSASGTLARKNYIKLFREFRGRIIATSSKPGQYSFGGRPHGGAFVNAFFNSFNSAINVNNPSWQEILRNASRPLVNGRQVPHFAINPAGVQPSTGGTTPVAQINVPAQQPVTTQPQTTQNYGSSNQNNSGNLSGDLTSDSEVPAENYSSQNTWANNSSGGTGGDLSPTGYSGSREEFNKGIKQVVTEEQDIFSYEGGLFTEINSSIWIQHTKQRVNAYYKVVQANEHRIVLERIVAGNKIIRMSLPHGDGEVYLYTVDQGWRRYATVKKQKAKVKFLIKREQNRRVVVNFNVTDIR